MNKLRMSAVAVVSTVALGGIAAPFATANAAAPEREPCAQQQAQVDRATAKLEALTAKFEAHPTKKNVKAKKAQVQRVAHAQARLDKCTAAQES
jgi:hypothetical protein